MTRYSPRVVAGLRWHGRESFNVMRYAYCPRSRWDRLRSDVLRERNVDLGAYPENAGMVVSWADEDGTARSVVVFNVSNDSESEDLHFYGSLAHESVHIAARIFDAMAEDEPGEETQAYVVGIVARNLLTEYRRSVS